VCANGRQEGSAVPKLKSHSGAKKRFKLTAKGHVKRGHSLANHILTKKTQKRKRKLRKSGLVSKSMEKTIRLMISA
jgi:large subunit ribosomal protein L35